MKELKLLFSQALKEARSNPLEVIGTLVAFVAICGMCYALMIVCYIIGG